MQDFAGQMRWLVDEAFPEAEVVRVVLANLKTHRPACLYESFGPAEARRILKRLQLQFTPKHGSWLNMAEIELSVLSRQCLDRRIPDELNQLYRTTRDVRWRTRAQIILLAAEQEMSAPAIATIVRESDQTVRNWLKRYQAEGLKDAPRPGSPNKVTPEYVTQLVELVRRRPRSLGLPFSLWTLARLADYRAEQTAIRVAGETLRRYLEEAEIVLSRPQHKISSPDPEYAVKKRRLRKPERG